jgi:hypothetical protein
VYPPQQISAHHDGTTSNYRFKFCSGEIKTFPKTITGMIPTPHSLKSPHKRFSCFNAEYHALGSTFIKYRFTPQQLKGITQFIYCNLLNLFLNQILP